MTSRSSFLNHFLCLHCHFQCSGIPSHKRRAIYILQRLAEALLGRFLVQNPLASAPNEGSKWSAKGHRLKALQRNILLSNINGDLHAWQAQKEMSVGSEDMSHCILAAGRSSTAQRWPQHVGSFLLLCQSSFWLIHELKMAPVAPNLSATFKGRKQLA